MLMLAVVAIAVSAQKEKVLSITADTLIGAETLTFDIPINFTGNNTLVIQALCTQAGGTSDGTLAVYGSLDGTSYSFINGVGAKVITASPQASITGTDLNQITITNGLVASWVINETDYKKFRITGVGTSGDSTIVAIKYKYR